LFQHIESRGCCSSGAGDAVAENGGVEPAFHGEGCGAVDGLEDQLGGNVAGEAEVYRCCGEGGKRMRKMGEDEC